MMMDLSRDAPLFDKQLNVKIVQGNHQSTSDARDLPLTFRILQGSLQNSQAHDRVLHFEITDENDPYFLYLLELSEQDFPSLKREQSILVDFAAFPSKLIELLAQCISERNDEAPAKVISSNELAGADAHPSTSSCAYYVRLDTNSGVFSVVESNRFKQLTHISLQLRPGNDASTKAYLASRLTHANTLHRRLTRDLASTRDQLAAELSLRRDLSEELRELRNVKELDLHSARNIHAEELLRVQTVASETLERTRESFQSQMSQLRTSSEEAARLAAERIADLENALLAEKQALSQSDFKVRELSRGSENSGTERSKLIEECAELRRSLRQSEIERGALDKEVVKLQMKCEALSLQIADRDEVVSRAGELQRASEDARRSAEDQVTLYRNSLEAVTEKLSAAVGEIKKGNQEISRQQQEMTQLKEKLAMKSEVIRRQEALVQELKARGTEVETSQQRSALALSGAKTEIDALQRELKTTKADLAECMENLARQNEVVVYLNRELTKCALGGGSTPLGAESFIHQQDDTHATFFRSPGSVAETPYTPGLRYQQSKTSINAASSASRLYNGVDSTTSKVQASIDFLKKNQGLKGLESVVSLVPDSYDLIDAPDDVSGYYAGLFGSTDLPRPAQKKIDVSPRV